MRSKVFIGWTSDRYKVYDYMLRDSCVKRYLLAAGVSIIVTQEKDIVQNTIEFPEYVGTQIVIPEQDDTVTAIHLGTGDTVRCSLQGKGINTKKITVRLQRHDSYYVIVKSYYGEAVPDDRDSPFWKDNVYALNSPYASYIDKSSIKTEVKGDKMH